VHNLRGAALKRGTGGVGCHAHDHDATSVSLVSQTIASVKQAALTTEEKQQILIGNGRRLMEAKGVKI
jgi:hypothetical protein